MEKKIELFGDVANCPIRNVLDRFGDKWSILVILLLKEGEKVRFGELRKAIGDISQKMLTVTLRSLEADGLVSREVFPEIPPRVEYELTELGLSLVPHIESLSAWASNHFPEIMASREAYS